MRPIIQRLKERKLVQWALAYLAGAFAVFSALQAVGEPWGVTDGFLRVVSVVLGVGFLVVLVLAWYHGEQGRQRVTGPELIMLGGLLGLLVIGLSLLSPERRGEPTAGTARDGFRSVAVLPFADLSPGGDHAYLSESLAEELLTALQQVPGLRVPASASSFQFRGRAFDPRAVGDTLGVDALLDGSVRVAGDRVGVSVQLVDAGDGSLVWNDDFELRPVELWFVEEEIAERVVEALGRTRDVAGLRLIPGGTNVPEAMEAYLAFLQVGSDNIEGRRQAVASLEAAVAADSTFVRAWSALAIEYMGAVNFYVIEEEADGLRKARAAVDRALELQPDLFEARLTRARLLQQTGNAAEAEAAYRSALERNPNSARARTLLSRVALGRGRNDEAIEQARLAIDLDPLGAAGWVALGRPLIATGQWEAALEAARRADDIDPDEFTPLAIASVARTQLGDHERAIELASQVVDLYPGDADGLVLLSYAQLQAGNREVAEESLRIVGGDSGGPTRPTAAASLSFLLGRYDEAFEWYDRAVAEERSVLVSILAHHGWPWFDAIRDDPRFSELLTRIGFQLPRS